MFKDFALLMMFAIWTFKSICFSHALNGSDSLLLYQSGSAASSPSDASYTFSCITRFVASCRWIMVSPSEITMVQNRQFLNNIALKDVSINTAFLDVIQSALQRLLIRQRQFSWF